MFDFNLSASEDCFTTQIHWVIWKSFLSKALNPFKSRHGLMYKDMLCFTQHSYSNNSVLLLLETGPQVQKLIVIWYYWCTLLHLLPRTFLENFYHLTYFQCWQMHIECPADMPCEAKITHVPLNKALVIKLLKGNRNRRRALTSTQWWYHKITASMGIFGETKSCSVVFEPILTVILVMSNM